MKNEVMKKKKLARFGVRNMSEGSGQHWSSRHPKAEFDEVEGFLFE